MEGMHSIYDRESDIIAWGRLQCDIIEKNQIEIATLMRDLDL